MTWMDRWIQKQRINQVIRQIPLGSNVLDVGCFQGELLRAMGKRLNMGFGMDPLLPQPVAKPRYKLLKGIFPDDWNIKTELNCVTLLAVFEHIASEKQKPTTKKIFDLLLPGGLAILTVPSKKADRLLNILSRAGLIHGMSLEEHYGFNSADTINIFESAGFKLIKHRTFQFGLNNLFVFKRPE
jgi:2-polyprenyl-3-methyl-5-hydroxy-6-metoxy-1,4-benzoquinol methylase